MIQIAILATKGIAAQTKKVITNYAIKQNINKKNKKKSKKKKKQITNENQFKSLINYKEENRIIQK